MIVENLTTLNIHKLSKEQYKRELEAGRIDENALYLTEDDESGVFSWNDLTDKPFYEEENLVDIYPLATVSGFTYEEEFGAPVSVIYYPQLAIGETYIVNWDDTEYTCIGQDVSAFTGLPGTVAIGNCSILIPGLIGNGEPFIIAGRLGEGMAIAFDQKESHKIRISQRSNIVTPLNNKYLDIFQRDEIIFPAKEADYISVNGMHFQLFPDDKCKINIGETYVVNWDGENYSCVAQALRHVGYPNGVYLGGNVPSFGVPTNEYPFCIVMTGEDSITAFSVGDPEGENVKHILQITRKVANSYLIKKEHLTQSDWFISDPESADYIKNKPFGYLPYGTILFSGKAVPQVNMPIYFGALDIPFMPYDIVRLGANINGDGYEYKDIEFNADKTMATSSSSGHTFHIFRSYAEANLENDGRTVYFAIEAEGELNPEGIDVVIKLDEWVNMHIPEIYLPKMSSLPEVSETDEGKVLSVVEGEWKPSDKLNNLATVDFVLDKIAEIQEPQVDEEVIFPEQEIHFNFNEEEDSWAWYSLTDPIGLEEGETYKVILNGKEYKSEPAELNTAYIDYNSIFVSVINDEGTEILQFEDYYSKETEAYDHSDIYDYISRSADITNVIEIRKWVDSSQTCNCPEDLIIRIEKSPIFSKSNLELLPPDVSTNVFSTYTIQLTSPIGLEYKKLYKIKIDEEEFISRVETVPASGGTFLCMGNHALLWGRLGEDTGENYYIADAFTNEQLFSFSAICVRDPDNSLESITRSIEIIPIDEQINNKYLPDNFGVEEETKVLFPEQELYFEAFDDDGDGNPDEGANPIYIQESGFGLESGLYTVTWNGKKYRCTCVQTSSEEGIIIDVSMIGYDKNNQPVFSITDLYVNGAPEIGVITDYKIATEAYNTVKIKKGFEEEKICNCPDDLIEISEGATIFNNSVTMTFVPLSETVNGYTTTDNYFSSESLLEDGKTYQITIGEEVMTATTEKLLVDSNMVIAYLGNVGKLFPEMIADNGQNFIYLEMLHNDELMSSGLMYIPDAEGEETITVNVQLKEIKKQINIKYIKDALQEGASSWNYLKDRPFYEGEGYTDIIPIAEVSGFTVQDSGFGVYVSMIQSPVKLNLIVGETYRVHWDGTDYDCVAKDASTLNIGGQESQVGGAIALGNTSALGIESEELPFLWVSFVGTDAIIAINDVPSHIVGLAKLEDTIHKLDDKYLDLMKDTSIVMPLRGFGGFMPDQEFGLPFQCAYDFYLDYSIDLNKTYEVIWDGTSYTCTPFDANDFFPGGMFLGNGSAMGYPGNGEPFAIGVVPIDDRYAAVYVDMVNSEPGLTHTAQINLVMPEEDKYKIPEKYISTGLPKITSADAGKFLRVSDLGTWMLEEIPLAEEAEF